MKNSVLFSVLMCCLVTSIPSLAANLDVKIAEDKPYTLVNHGEDLVKVQRIQDTSNTLEGAFTKTSRPCPPFCVNPLNVEEGVATVAELEVVKFMEESMNNGNGVMIDVRTPNRYQKGTIPGSVNIPFTVFEKSADDPDLVEALERLGVKQRDEVNVVMRSLEKVGLFDGDEKTDRWDFSEASQLLLWCNGPRCGQSPRAIHALVALGYPAEKLYYYRGGMQMWQSLGLSTVLPSDMSSYASK
jgi:rhodanese-related sulfurtransferase